MTKIAEKFEFMKVTLVTVCAKAATGRSPGHKNPYFV